MLKKLARELKYSLDGITVVSHNAGEEVEIRDENVSGLDAEGYFEAETKVITTFETTSAVVQESHPSVVDSQPQNPEPAPSDQQGSDAKPKDEHPERTAVEIIDAWEFLDWSDLRSLANSLTTDKVTSKAEAIETIKAELERRMALK